MNACIIMIKKYLSFYSILTQRTDAAEARSRPVKLRFALL